MEHIYKSNEIRVFKNSKGHWQTVFVENDFNGNYIPYGEILGYKCSRWQAKKKFAESINKSNKTAKEHNLPWRFSVHKDCYLNSKNKRK